MKNIFILQNSQRPIEFNISKIFNPTNYRLHLITDSAGISNLTKEDRKYFNSIDVIDEFNEKLITQIIEDKRNIDTSFDIIATTEGAVSICGKLRVKYGLQDIDSERFINKIKMKDILKKYPLKIPKYILFDKKNYLYNPSTYLDDITSELTFPIFAKPIDQASCIGTEKIETIESLKAWCKSNIASKFEFELDEFIDGKLFHCDSYIKNGVIVHTNVSECSRPCFDFLLGKTKGSIALPNNHKNYLKLRSYAEDALTALGTPQNGVTHLEIFETINSELVFLEVAHRSPGILIPEMYRISSGIDTREAHILLSADDSYKINVKSDFYSAWAAFPAVEGTIEKLYSPEISSQYKLSWYYQEGDKMMPAMKGRDHVGTILLWNKNYNQLKNDFEFINNFCAYTLRQ